MKPNSKNPWSGVIFSAALAALVWGSVELLNLTKYDYITIDPDLSTSDISTIPADPQQEEGEGTINILDLKVEQIENLANTIAGRNAIWPGYQGDKEDNKAIQRHFFESFAKFINSGKIQVQEDWKGRSIAFAYAVSEKGVLTFVGKIPGGSIADNYAYVAVKQGIDGQVLVTPAQDEEGDDIIMIYYIKVNFSLL